MAIALTLSLTLIAFTATTNFIGPLVAGVSIDHIGHAAAALVIVALSATAFIVLALGWRFLPKPRPQAPRAVIASRCSATCRCSCSPRFISGWGWDAGPRSP